LSNVLLINNGKWCLLRISRGDY